jgi:hypothetical protein
MIPEDSILRRHYLTELKYKQQSQFEHFIAATRADKRNIIPDSHSRIPFSTVMFGVIIFTVLLLIF